MNIQRRVYFSLPITAWRNGHETGLSPAQFDLVNALAGKLDSMGYTVQVFARFGILSDPEIANTPWSYEAVERVMRLCVGALPDQSDIAPIEDTIRKFVRYRL